jgi:hypothetical protein
MTGPKTITANFVPEEHKVAVSLNGNGYVEGTGINCPGDCTEGGFVGAQFTLVAKPETDPAKATVFTGWSGACQGTGPCVVTIDHANVFVTANFAPAPNYFFVTSGVFTGQLDGLDGADKKCQMAADAAGLGGKYVAYLSSINGNTPINAPSRVGNARGWRLTTGENFLRKIDEFHAGGMLVPPSTTELRAPIPPNQLTLAWTGTSGQGTYLSACSPSAAFIPWAGTSGEAMMGNALAMSSQAVAVSANRCASAARLYCFGIDRAVDF